MSPTSSDKSVSGKWVYSFGGDNSEGQADMRNLLGGKSANLAEMASLGLPVPPGFTINTEVCTHFYDHGRQYPDELKAQVKAALAGIEATTGRAFGDAAAEVINPLGHLALDFREIRNRPQCRSNSRKQS